MPVLTRRHVAALAVVLAASLPYLRTIPDYFVQDDFGGMQLLAAKPWHTFPRWFTMPWMEFIWGYMPDEIRPFTALSYQITALWGASAPEGHHVLNIVLHAANGLLALGIARAAAGLSLAGATVAAVGFVLLPMGAESVAWITGRVDSLPAFFYLLSFLYYVWWRQRGQAPLPMTAPQRCLSPLSPVAFSAAAGANRVYAWSLWWFFVALFSKQNTITMLPAIVAFDLIVAGRPVRFSWSWIRPYLPFAVLTVGFLALRYILLGEVVRESQLSSQRFAEFSGILARHLQRMIWGDLGTVPDAVRGFAAGYAILTILALVRVDASTRRSAIRVALYFGLVWIALGLAPTVAAGYESPRHAYLAAPGWTIMIGLAFDLLRAAAFAAGNPPSEALRRAQLHAISIGTITVLTLYGVRLHREVTDWRLRAAVAHAGVIELERQVLAAPEGTLFLVSVPVSSWEWGAPFVAKPPYASTDLTARADIVVPERLHCCRGRWWDAETRGAIDRWLQRRTPIVALYASAGGEIRRLTDSEAADLRVLVESLRDIRSTGNLDGAIQDILRKLVAGRGQIVRAAIDR